MPASDPLIEHRPFGPTVSAAPDQPLFELLDADRTGASFQMQFPDFARHIHEMIHLSVYGGICAGDFDGDGLTDFYVTRPAGGNRLFRNRGDFRFEDVTEAANVADTNFWATGATFADVNNDGRLDIYACAYGGANRLFINAGPDPDSGARFVEQARDYGLDYRGASMMMAFADMDRDGDLDAYLATTAQPPPPGVELRIAHENGRQVIPRELQEYWGLIQMPNGRTRTTEAGQFDHLYRNDEGRFVEVTEDAGIDGPFFTLSAQWWDYDADGWPDLYVANDFNGPDRLYRNNGDGTFSDVIARTMPHTPYSSMGTDIGDLNQDGRIDLLATDMMGSSYVRRQLMLGDVMNDVWAANLAEPRQYRRNAVYLNSGAGRMLEVAHQFGMESTDWTWCPRIEDFDNDGFQDVLFFNGMLRDVQHSDKGPSADRTYGGGSKLWAQYWAGEPMLTETNLAYRNLGAWRFERTEGRWGLARRGMSLGAATADLDGDGDLDLLVNNADAPVSIYRNQSHAQNRILVRLRGTQANRFGINATVRVRAGGRQQLRYLTATRGWLSSSDPVAHFGLGPIDRVTRLEIEWPSGTVQTFQDLAGNAEYTVTEPAVPSAHAPDVTGNEDAKGPLFEPTDAMSAVSFAEAPFDDYVREPLLPRQLSMRGGRLAWGDVNGDGLTDVYLAAPPGNTQRLYLQSEAHEFAPSTQPAIAANQDCDDADAVFLDVDGDQDLDLFVAGGGVRAAAGHQSHRHRLYLNDGSGVFSDESDNRLPAFEEGAGCVAVGDLNGDGALDLFLGGASVPGRYPLAGASRLWMNTEGRFTDQTPDELKNLGIVTDAVWIDVTGNGASDLVATVEWGPVRLFGNNGGVLTEQTARVGLASRTGWWNAIASGDVDGDGDVDFAVGNHGLNSAVRPTLQQPELLFYGDLDGSGRQNLLRAFFIGQFGYPHDGFALLQRAMPLLSSRIHSYEQFAASNIEQLFTLDRLRRSTVREANTMASALWINDGDKGMRFQPLPAAAQVAPGRDLEFVDADGDGALDLVIGQNDLSYRYDIGCQDGGVSLVLLGDGRGGFEPLPTPESGVMVAGDVRDLSIQDLNGDQKADLVFVTRPEGIRAFLRR